MKILQEKSKCCGARIIRFGGKRRQCVVCKTTWRVWPSKPGRKALRQPRGHLRKIFCGGFSVKQIASRSGLSAGAVYKRFHNNLLGLVEQRRIIRIRGPKLILIIDALWQYFNGQLWTLYCLAIKPTGGSKVVILDPVLRLGKENSATWKDIIYNLPPGVKNRIVAIVSDGIRGIETVAQANNWIIQRCHFHLLSWLQKMRGKRISTPGRMVREEIYSTVKSALAETSEHQLGIFFKRLAILAEHPLCPKKMKMATREFLRRAREFRSYLEYPELNLPTTVNVMESVNSIIRKKVKTINSPHAWCNWSTATIRFKSKFNCKGTNYQPNCF